MPYFLSNSITEAITTEEQSVSGMKPIFTSSFSCASEPCAHTPLRTASGTMRHQAAPAFRRRSRAETRAGFFIVCSLTKNKKAFAADVTNPERLRSCRRAPLTAPCLEEASAVPERPGLDLQGEERRTARAGRPAALHSVSAETGTH